MNLLFSILTILPVFLGVIYFIFEFSNAPQDFISYEDF
ncbi:MAG: hypothetical protein NSGCLCUN01_03722 [uncultured Clostridium sp.]